MSTSRDIIIGAEHRPYLFVQRGEVSHVSEPTAWTEAYKKSLQTIIDNIEPVLPKKCERLLDIGSGLGGIDILINAKYPNDVHVHLLDGFDDAPVVHKHAQTFNDMHVALDFHRVNGTQRVTAIAPSAAALAICEPFDLIVSFASYCFHYAPNTYLEALLTCTHDNTVVIFDVRREKTEWISTLTHFLGEPLQLDEGRKFIRLAFGARAKK